jgi:molecular chaperone DnaK
MAKDKGTGKEHNIRIEASSGLTEEEIKKMKQEAEANADADKAAKETAEKINGADSMVFQTEKQLKEFGEKLSDDKKAPIEAALTELKAAHISQDIAQIDAAMEKINEAWKNASEEMYKAEQEAQADGAGATGAAGAESAEGAATEDDVQDVDFEEVEEEK